MTRPRSPLANHCPALYGDYNREDSASDPVHRVRPYPDAADREVAGFCAAALAFGRVASVLNSIDTLFRILGPHPAAFVRTFDPAAPHPELRAMVHRWTRGEDIAALLWILRQMLEQSGSIERFFARGASSPSRGRRHGARPLLDPRAGARHPPRLRPRAEGAGRVLFLPAAVGGQRLQAAEPVPALDGPPTTRWISGSGRGVAVEADRAARHARHPARTMPPADALYEPGLAHGGGHHARRCAGSTLPIPCVSISRCATSG